MQSVLFIVVERAAFIRYNLAKAMRRLNSTTYNATGRSIEPRLFLEPNALLSPTQLLEFEVSRESFFQNIELIFLFQISTHTRT